MRRKAVQVVGDPIRLDWLSVMRRQIDTLRRAGPMAPAARIALVFNATEIGLIRRLAKGENIRGINLTQEQAAKKLAWIEAGGRYPDYDVEGDDGA